MSNFRLIRIRSVLLNIRRAWAIWHTALLVCYLPLLVWCGAEPWLFCAAWSWRDPIHYWFADYPIRLSMLTSNSSSSNSCSDILYILSIIKAQQHPCSFCLFCTSTTIAFGAPYHTFAATFRRLKQLFDAYLSLCQRRNYWNLLFINLSQMSAYRVVFYRHCDGQL